MTTTSPASMGGPQGDRTGFEPRHPNAVPARCDGCPAPARWTRGGSRYCDEHARLTTAPSRTDRVAAVAPLSDEELTLYGDLIDTVPGPGPALSWTAEARLLAEAQRARARVGVLEGQLATAQAESTELGAKLKDFLDGQSRIAKVIGETEDKFEQQRLLGLAEARATLRSVLDGCDDFMVPTIRACTGCGKCSYCTARGITAASVLGLDGGDPDA